LLHRKRTGRGQYVDLAQVEAAITLTGTAVVDYTVNGRHSERIGNRSGEPPMCPHGVYRCAPSDDERVGDDEWVAIAAANNEHWRALAKTIDRPEWAADKKLSSLDERFAREAEIDSGIETWTRPRSSKDGMQTLQSAGVPAGRVQRSRDLY